MEELGSDRVVGQHVRLGDSAIASGRLVKSFTLFEHLLEGLSILTDSTVLSHPKLLSINDTQIRFTFPV